MKKPATFGERATAVMETIELSRKMHANDVARMAPMHAKRVKNIFSGKVDPTAKEADTISKVLEVPVGYLINGEVREDAADQELAEPVKAVEEEPACSCDGATGEGQKCNECGDGVVGD